MDYLEVLKNKISESGLTKDYIARALNIKYDTFRRKLKGEHGFKVSELLQLCSILNIKIMEVFENVKNS